MSARVTTYCVLNHSKSTISLRKCMHAMIQSPRVLKNSLNMNCYHWPYTSHAWVLTIISTTYRAVPPGPRAGGGGPPPPQARQNPSACKPDEHKSCWTCVCRLYIRNYQTQVFVFSRWIQIMLFRSGGSPVVPPPDLLHWLCVFNLACPFHQLHVSYVACLSHPHPPRYSSDFVMEVSFRRDLTGANTTNLEGTKGVPRNGGRN